MIGTILFLLGLTIFVIGINLRNKKTSEQHVRICKRLEQLEVAPKKPLNSHREKQLKKYRQQLARMSA